MKRKLISTLVMAGLTLVAGSASAADKYSDNAVRIAVLTDMSGGYSDLGGQGSVVAAEMAIEDFKRDAKPKFTIDKVVYADHQNKPDIGSNKVREWYDTQGVDMVTDGLNSGVALATAKVTAEKKRVFIDVGAASTKLTNEECTPYTVHYAYDTYSLANGTAKAIVKSGGKTWFFLTADYAFGASLEKDSSDVVKANGGTVLGSVKHPLNASDFSSFLLQAQSSQAQIIGLANAGTDTQNAIKAAAEFGITKNQSLAGMLVFITDVNALGLKATQGMLLTDGWYWDQNNDSRAFARRFFERMKKMPSMVQAGVYSATYQYLKAVQAAGTDDADTVMKKLKSTTINDMFTKNGKIRQDGRMVHDMYLMQVKKPEESKYDWDYYKVVATIPAADAFQPLSASKCPMVTAAAAPAAAPKK
jgi:branched-chain amino acid transport system substrate-binding protein